MLGGKEQLRILAILRAVYGRHSSAQLTMGQSFQKKKLWGNHFKKTMGQSRLLFFLKKGNIALQKNMYTTLFILHNFSSGPNLKEYKSWASKVATVCQM
jgi:hypothetical protein